MENNNLMKNLLFGDLDIPLGDPKSLNFVLENLPEISNITREENNYEETESNKYFKLAETRSNASSPNHASQRENLTDNEASSDSSSKEICIFNIFQNSMAKPSDFLDTLGYEDTHRIFQFSKLYYPPGKSEFKKLQKTYGFKVRKVRNKEIIADLNELDLNDFQEAFEEEKKQKTTFSKFTIEKRKKSKITRKLPSFGPEYFANLRRKLTITRKFDSNTETSKDEDEKDPQIIIHTEDQRRENDERSFLSHFNRLNKPNEVLWGEIETSKFPKAIGELVGDNGGEQEVNLRDTMLINSTIRNEFVDEFCQIISSPSISNFSKKIMRLKSAFSRVYIPGDCYGQFYDEIVRKNLAENKQVFEEVNEESLLGNSVAGKNDKVSVSKVPQSDIDSISVTPKPLPSKSSLSFQKAQKNREKEQRILAVLQGHDPNNIQTEENALSKKTDMLMPDQSILSLGIESKVANRHGRLQHAVLTDELMFEDYRNVCNGIYHFHNPDIRKSLEESIWKVRIVREEPKKLGDNAEVVDSHEYFKTSKRLSCMRGAVTLFESIEESPLHMQILGMRSKVSKYIYPCRLKNTEDRNAFRAEVLEKFGQLGNLIFLQPNEKIPLLGQLTQEKNIGIAVVENNLFRAPIFIQKLPKTDFLLVRHFDETRKSFRYALRVINEIYIMGQIEPKLEIFAPNSRSNSKFIRKSIRHIIREYFQRNGVIDVRQLSREFPLMNEHNLKKNVREMGGEPDYNDQKTFKFSQYLFDEMEANGSFQKDSTLTPEDVCLYERMSYSLCQLKRFGLKKMTSADKILIALSKFCKRNPSNFRVHVIAKLITEELQLTTWNLSQSFLVARQTQGRLFLSGYGDPTNGHGGISYVKKPLKSSRHEKDDEIDGALKSVKVTGTSADLRKMETPEMKRILLSYGCNPQYLQTLTRWDKVDLLRRVSNLESQDGLNKESELAKFSRTLRVTTKMQREKYQKEINRQLAFLIENFTMSEEQISKKIQEFYEIRKETPLLEDLVRAEKKNWLLKRRAVFHHLDDGEHKQVKLENK